MNSGLPRYNKMQIEELTADRNSPDLTVNFKALFYPKSIAFLGASSDPIKWGFRILENIVGGGYQGKIYPINPKGGEILGLKVYTQVADIPKIPDFAVFVVPPPSVPGAVKECINKGIKAGVVITAGFAEIGEDGVKLQQEAVQIARSGGMILVGPNSMGIGNSAHKLYCQMPSLFPNPGPIAIVSQSGNIIGSLMRQFVMYGFGCSKYISSGNEADLHAKDYFRYLADDPQTGIILSYIEGLKDGPAFFQITKETSKKKPIIMLKSGVTPAGARAALSHTASLAGSDAVFESMCKQAGIIRVKTLDELMNTSIGFLCHKIPRGHRVGIVAAGGGWGVLAADACADLGLDVVTLPADTINELNSLMPGWWNRGNPIDLVAGVFGDTLLAILDVVLRCSVVDGVILLGLLNFMPLLLGPSLSASAEEKEQRGKAISAIMDNAMDKIAELAKKYDKPVITASDFPTLTASFIQEINQTLAQKNHVFYTLPHQAASVFASLANYGKYRQQSNA